MDRARLAKNGIFIEDGDGGCELLPPHVEALQEALLDFRRTIPDRLGCDEEKILRVLDKGGSRRDDVTDDERAEMLDELESGATVRELTRRLALACRLKSTEYSEEDWSRHFQESFLDPLVEAAEANDRDTRQSARAKFYYDSFQQARDRPWTLFDSDGERGDLTQPKPAWVAHFPVYVIFPADGPQRHSGLLKFASSHSIVDNFSQTTLEHLASHGLHISATGVTSTGRRGAALDSEYVCFPWLIVEHMKDEYKGNWDLCYTQAANAGSAALEILQNLAKHETKCVDDTHIPPVVTVTTEHNVVGVWIMHSAQSKGTCEMHLAWSGSMTRMVDIFQLRAILENCQTWATRVLRPWISRQIDLWKQQCPDDCPRPFDASLRYRAAQNPASYDEDTPERGSKTKDRKEEAGLRHMIKEQHDRLLEQLSGMAVEKKKPTRSMATQTGPDDNKQPPEQPPKQPAVPPTTVEVTSPFPPRKILPLRSHTPKKPTASSSTQGKTTPADAQKATDDATEMDDKPRQMRASNLFKSSKKVFGEKRIFTIKLPDVSSDEIVAAKPWLGARKAFGAGKQATAVLTQKSEEVKYELEGGRVEKEKVEKGEKGGDTTYDKKDDAENEYEEKGDDSDDSDDESYLMGDIKGKGREEAPTASLIGATEATSTRLNESMYRRAIPKAISEAGSMLAEYGSRPTSPISPKKPFAHVTIDAEDSDKENGGETIEKDKSEKQTEDEALGDITEEKKPGEAIENDTPEESVAKEKGDPDAGHSKTKLPLLTPESEPADPLSVDPPASPRPLVWREGFGQENDDDHKEPDQHTATRDTPPRDEPADALPADIPSTPKAAQDTPSTPTKTKPSTFDTTKWTQVDFAFDSPSNSNELPAVLDAAQSAAFGTPETSSFTFKMKPEGAPGDPRNASIPGGEAEADRIFDWAEDDEARAERLITERLFDFRQESDGEWDRNRDPNPQPTKRRRERGNPGSNNIPGP